MAPRVEGLGQVSGQSFSRCDRAAVESQLRGRTHRPVGHAAGLVRHGLQRARILGRGRCGSGRSAAQRQGEARRAQRSEEHTSELQSLMRISYAVLCLKKKTEENIQTLQ